MKNHSILKKREVSMNLSKWLVLVMLIHALSAPAGEAFGERRPAEIPFTDRGRILQLVEKGINIDRAGPETILVWVSAEQFDWIRSQGIPVEWTEDQAKVYFEALRKSTEATADPLGHYHTYEEMTAQLQAYATGYPSLCRLSSIGQSVQGRELWILKITDEPDVEELEPEVKYISTMHGNEPVGTEMMLNLIELLLTEYDSNPRIQTLVNETELWIMPLMNPDGHAIADRFNANGVDLNRNFPDRVDDPTNTPEGRQPETRAVMNFSGQHSFVLSANFHTGALVVNYPYDSSFYPYISQHPDWFSPDQDVFVHISTAYASQNPPMASSTYFPGGISNGISWYIIHGGMQDWNYVWMGCNEVTIELSDSHIPPEDELPQYWQDNRESLLAYLEQAQIGVRGRVLDAATATPLDATVTVTGRDHDVFTDPDRGDYYRLLLPGTYELNFQCEGYFPKTISAVEVEAAEATVLDVTLESSSSQTHSNWAVY